MEIRKTMIPTSHKGVPLGSEYEKEYIYFTVTYNHFRDVSSSQEVVMRDREEMQECECVLSLPASYTEDGEETPLILSFHGSGHRVCEKENMIGGICSVTQCVDAGYAALDVNGSEPHGRTIGCFEHLMAAYKAYRYAVKHFNLSKQILVAGASMGGQTAINFINMFPNIVTAVGLFYPRLNIDTVDVDGHTCLGSWDKEKFQADVGCTQRQRTARLHRFPTDEWCPENVVGFNPYHIRSFVNQDGEKVVIPPCPIKIWHGTADPTVDYMISVGYINAIRRGGTYAELRLLDGVLHRTNDVMRQELLYWFNRFL